MSYSRKIFICPYYQTNARDYVTCEGGKIKMDREMIRKYEDRYCASYDWEKCSIAMILTEAFERGNGTDTGGER